MTPLLPLALLAALAQDPEGARVRWFDPAPDLDRQILEAFQDLVEADTPEHRREAARWTAQRDRVVRTFRHPVEDPTDPGSSRLYQVGVDRAGRWVVTTGEETLIWSVETGRVFLRDPFGQAEGISFSEDSRRLLLASGYEPAVVLDLPEARRIFEVPADWNEAALALEPSGRHLAVIDWPDWESPRDRILHLVDLDTGTEGVCLPLPSPELGLVAFSPDGRWLALGGNGLYVLDRVQGGGWRELSAPDPDRPGFESLCFRREGSLLAVLAESTLHTFDLVQGRETSRTLADDMDWLLVDDEAGDRWVTATTMSWTRVSPHTGQITAYGEASDDLVSYERTKYGSFCALSPDGRTFAIAGNGDSVLTWDTETGRRHSPPYAHGALVLPMALSSDGHMVTGSENGIVRLWRVGNGQGKDFGRWTHEFNSSGLWPSPDATRAVWSRRRVDLVLVDPSGSTQTLPPPGDELSGLSTDPAGTTLVAGSSSERVWRWDLTDPSPTPRWTGETGYVLPGSLDRTGSRLALARSIGTQVVHLDSERPDDFLRGSGEGDLYWNLRGDLVRGRYGCGEYWNPVTGTEYVPAPSEEGTVIPCWDGRGFLHVVEQAGGPPIVHALERGEDPIRLTLPDPLPATDHGLHVRGGDGVVLLVADEEALLLERSSGRLLSRFPVDRGSSSGSWGHLPNWGFHPGRFLYWWVSDEEGPTTSSEWILRSSRDGQRLAGGRIPGTILEGVVTGRDGGVAFLVRDHFAQTLEVPSGRPLGPELRLGDRVQEVAFEVSWRAKIRTDEDPRWEIDLRTGEARSLEPHEPGSTPGELGANPDPNASELDGWTEPALDPVRGATLRWRGRRLQVIDAVNGTVRVEHVVEQVVHSACMQHTGPWITVFTEDQHVLVLEERTGATRLRIRHSTFATLTEDLRWLIEGSLESYPSRLVRSRVQDLDPDRPPVESSTSAVFWHLGQDLTRVHVEPDGIRVTTIVPPRHLETPVRVRHRPDTTGATLLRNGDRWWKVVPHGDHLEFEVWPRPLHDLEPVVGDPEALLESWALRLGREWVDGEWVPRR